MNVSGFNAKSQGTALHETDEIKSRVTVLDVARADGLDLKKAGSNWVCCCPIHPERTPSFTIYPGERGFYCFGCGEGGDVFNYVQLSRKMNFVAAKDCLAGFAGLTPGTFKAFTAKARQPTPTTALSECLPIPVPSDAPPPPQSHYKLGQPVAFWIYHDATGRAIAHVLRFVERDNQGNPIINPETGKPKKTDRPLTWGKGKYGSYCWNWKGWPAPKPLFNLRSLVSHPTSTVVVCEGEKAASAAAILFPKFVCTTAMNGAQSPAKTDWTPLRGRNVLIWPDFDEQGEQYAAAVTKLTQEAGAASVQVLKFVP